jgi:uncharacterized repeat protein (TIGR03809 family)
MTHRNDAARGADVLGRWRLLAEQRLEHLTELFESGRWRRYHNEQAFLENIKEAKKAVETWRGLSGPKAVPRKPVAAAQSILIRALAPAPVTAPEPIEIPKLEERFVARAETPAASGVAMLALDKALDVPELTIDLAAIEQRYPLLRNRM